MHESAFGRLIAVLFSPSKTFEAIARRPTWVAAMLVLIGLSLAVTAVVTPKMDMGDMIRSQVEESGREVPAEQLERQVEFMSRFQWVFAAVGVLVQPVIYLLVALIFWVVFRLLGSEHSFVHSLSVTLHGMMPLGVAAIISLPVVMARQEIAYEDVRTGGFLASNLGAFAPEDAARPVVSLLSSLDVFSIWVMVLLVIGYRVVGRVSRGSAIGVVVGLWALYVVGKVGLSAIMGR